MNYIIKPFSIKIFNSLQKYTQQANYLFRYLQELSAKTVIIEYQYVDRDFMIDYSSFYSRCFQDYKRFTKRFHFFKAAFKGSEFKTNLFRNVNNRFLYSLIDNYLGFFVAKPLHKTIIGRTLLVPYPKTDEEGNIRYFPTITKATANLFGLELPILSIPYQEQDQAVCACATIAIWVGLLKISKLFNINAQLSPAEVTFKANEAFPGLERIYPSSGLNLPQIISFFKMLGLDVEYLDTNKVSNMPSFILSYIYAYLKFGIPIIALIELKHRNNEIDYHAVTITGYKIRSNHAAKNKAERITELFVHDDQIGPFSRVLFKDNPLIWDNEWSEKYSQIFLSDILVPVYPKIRLSFGALYNFLFNLKRFHEWIDESKYFDIYLTTVEDYKKETIQWESKKKEQVLSANMPRFLWVVRFEIYQGMVADWLIDATESFPRLFEIIFYQTASK